MAARTLPQQEQQTNDMSRQLGEAFGGGSLAFSLFAKHALREGTSARRLMLTICSRGSQLAANRS